MVAYFLAEDLLLNFLVYQIHQGQHVLSEGLLDFSEELRVETEPGWEIELDHIVRDWLLVAQVFYLGSFALRQ